MRNHRRGFTLIELLVAITITGMVLLLAHALFGAVADGAARIGRHHAEAEARAASLSWMHEILRSAEIGRPDDGGFEGATDSAAFTGYLRTPGGWPERRRITLKTESGSLLLLAGDDTLPMQRGVRGVSFDYLLEPGAGSRWVNEWHSPVSVPLAIRLRLADSLRVDTMLFLVGTRG